MGQLWVSFLAGVKNKLDFSSYQKVCAVLIDTWNSIPSREDADALQFELGLGHSCAAGACGEGTCTLCVNSASRPCPQIFKSKYLLRDGIVPACGSPASVSIYRSGRPGVLPTTAELQTLPPFVYQVCALPWTFYKENKDAIPWDTIHGCKTITTEAGKNEEGVEAVLATRDVGHMETDGFISFPNAIESAQGIPTSQLLSHGAIKLPEVFFPKRSAEALLDGKRPQLVLVVRAVHAHTGAPILSVLPAASTPFHVATRRTRGNEKAYIPSMDQEVRVLEHIGDACIKKLKDLPQHVGDHPEIVIPPSIPDGKVQTVAHMAALVDAVGNDKTAESKLFLKTLKLNDDRLTELKEQLKRAVRPDSQLRVFYCGTYPQPPLPGLLEGPVDVGLIFTCTRGTVDLHEGGICGVVMRTQLSDAATAQERIVPRDHLIQEPQLKPLLLMHARRAWCTSGHPGWGFYTFQGRATSRMPPEISQSYPVDPNKIPCFTPNQYTDAAEAPQNADGAAAGAGDAPGQAQQAAAAEASQVAVQAAAQDVAAAAGQAPEGYGPADMVHAAQAAAAESASQAQAERAAVVAAATAAAAAAAHRPASPRAASAAATLVQASRAVPQEHAGAETAHSSHASHSTHAAQVALQLPHVISAAAAHPVIAAVAASQWMNTHELAAAAQMRPAGSHGAPLALFQPSGMVNEAGVLVRPRTCSDASIGQAHKRVRHTPDTHSAPYGAASQAPPEADRTGARTAISSASFPSLGGFSDPGGVSNTSQNPGLMASMLFGGGMASSDLGTMVFGGNTESMPSATPGSSIELAVP